MNITNQYGAPEIFIKAIEGDPYDMGDADISVTGLIQPPQIARLRKEHEDKLSTDVSDEIFKLLGSGVHAVLERHGGDNAEQRYFAEHTYGVKISGAIDLVEDNGAVTDYKVTSVFTTQRALKADWESQLNLYAWLLDQNDIEATSLTIVAVCRDWIKSRVGKYGDYPASPIVVIPVPLWSAERRQRFVDRRVETHTQEKTIPCTNEERWARGAYQVVGGRGRPKKFDTLPEATNYVNKQKTGVFSVVDTNATYVRCESWCDVSQFCPQWRGATDGNGKTANS